MARIGPSCTRRSTGCTAGRFRSHTRVVTINDASRPNTALNLGRMRRISILEAGPIASVGLSHVGGEANATPTFDRGPPMLTRSLLIRIAGPTVFVSLLFLGSCITAAIYLHHRQSASVQVLDEAIASRRVAGDLLEALDGLASLPMDRRAEAGALHRQILGLLAKARRGVDKPEEGRLVGRLEDSFGRYLRREAHAASGPASLAAGR